MDRLSGEEGHCTRLVRRGAEQVQCFSSGRYLQRLEGGYRKALG